MIDTMIEIKLKDDDDFLKVRETLTRIGVASKKSQTLYQSCHILHKRGKFYIVHFKELFALDNKVTDFSDEDRGRRNKIANLLAEWGLITLVDPEKSADPVAAINTIKILPYNQKDEWTLTPKYNIGNSK